LKTKYILLILNIVEGNISFQKKEQVQACLNWEMYFI